MAAVMEWPPTAAELRTNGLADAYADNDDDEDDAVDLVEYPDIAVQELPVMPPEAHKTPVEASVEHLGLCATPAHDAAPRSDEEMSQPPASGGATTATKKPGDDDAPSTGNSHLPLVTISEDKESSNTLTPQLPNSTAFASSDMDSAQSAPSSPLRQPIQDDAPESPLSDVSLLDAGDGCEFDFDYDESNGNRLIRLRPTAEQWDDFPGLLAFARKLGARNDGCFKLMLPESLRQPLPYKSRQILSSNAYKAKQIRRTTFWQLSTARADGEFYTPEDADAEPTESVEETLKALKKAFRKSKGRQMRHVRYRPDVPAWNSEQRREAGVPADWSPIHPLRGDKLDRTKAVVPGIHTPYVYESAPHFGATFQIHAEDYRLLSLNHLYRGRKIWIVVPCTAIDVAEQALRRGRSGSGADTGCSQFMRHRAEFFFPEKLDQLGIPYRIVDQRPGETIVILPDAYHEGYSTGYTLAEAKNYADDDWSTESYRPCMAHCQLLTAIPPDYMRIMADGEEGRVDLCALHDQSVAAAKRAAEAMDNDETEDDNGDGDGMNANANANHDMDAKRIKLDQDPVETVGVHQQQEQQAQQAQQAQRQQEQHAQQQAQQVELQPVEKQTG